jgi:hypothetical protein
MPNFVSSESKLTLPMKTNEHPVNKMTNINIAEGETSQAKQFKFLS